MTGQRMKISELAAEIERVMVDPTTKFWIKSNRKYYFLRSFPLDNLESAGRCMAIIQTIIGYNVKQVIFKGELWILIAPSLQKKPFAFALKAPT